MATVTPAYTLTVGEPYDPVLINAIFSALTIGAILGSEIATGTITGSNIASSTITGSNITADAIGASHIASNTISADKIQSDAVTATKIQAGAVTADKIYAGAVTADKMSVTSLAAISANLGEVTSGTITAGTVRTSASPGTNRVIMDAAGLRGYDNTLGQVFNIYTDGTPPLFANGTIQSATIIDTTIISNDFKTSNTLPWIEIDDDGISFREGGTDSLYGTATYSTDESGGVYGPTQAGFIFNDGKPLFSVEKERDYADIHLYNRTASPAGACTIGDMVFVDGRLKICDTAGTGVGANWTVPGNFRGVEASGPGSPLDGDTYINSGDNKLYIYYGKAWQELHTLTPAAAELLLMESGDSLLMETGDVLLLE